MIGNFGPYRMVLGIARTSNTTARRAGSKLHNFL